MWYTIRIGVAAFGAGILTWCLLWITTGLIHVATGFTTLSDLAQAVLPAQVVAWFFPEEIYLVPESGEQVSILVRAMTIVMVDHVELEATFEGPGRNYRQVSEVVSIGWVGEGAATYILSSGKLIFSGYRRAKKLNAGAVRVRFEKSEYPLKWEERVWGRREESWAQKAIVDYQKEQGKLVSVEKYFYRDVSIIFHKQNAVPPLQDMGIKLRAGDYIFFEDVSDINKPIASLWIGFRKDNAQFSERGSIERWSGYTRVSKRGLRVPIDCTLWLGGDSPNVRRGGKRKIELWITIVRRV